MNAGWISLQYLGFSMYEAHPTGIVSRISNQRILQRKCHGGQYIKLDTLQGV